MKLEYKSLKDTGNGCRWHEFSSHSMPVREEDFLYCMFRFEKGGREYTRYSKEFKEKLTWAMLSND